ncbi:hypothetical protein [uncultured Clostridium sp.]|uniref:hypothetical protein n=1 Tax=uncultured Clostridium sp. TaxID=59620 RepID=UPI0026172974|nr:hypothetical protein [uncultured Clostridium sp.]
MIIKYRTVWLDWIREAKQYNRICEERVEVYKSMKVDLSVNGNTTQVLNEKEIELMDAGIRVNIINEKEVFIPYIEIEGIVITAKDEDIIIINNIEGLSIPRYAFPIAKEQEKEAFIDKLILKFESFNIGEKVEYIKSPEQIKKEKEENEECKKDDIKSNIKFDTETLEKHKASPGTKFIIFSIVVLAIGVIGMFLVKGVQNAEASLKAEQAKAAKVQKDLSTQTGKIDYNEKPIINDYKIEKKSKPYNTNTVPSVVSNIDGNKEANRNYGDGKVDYHKLNLPVKKHLNN